MPITPVSGGSRSLILYTYLPPFKLLADASDAIEASVWDPWGMANISKRCIFSLLSVATRTHDDTHDATCTPASGQGRRRCSDNACIHAAASKLPFKHT